MALGRLVGAAIVVTITVLVTGLAYFARVERTFADFDDYWTTILMAPSMGPKLAAMTADEIATLAATMRSSLPADSGGRITCSARANAVKGRVPN